MTTVRRSLDNIPDIPKRRAKELAAMSDDQIDYTDIPELGDNFWAKVKLGAPVEPKETVTMRIDRDVLAWFKSQGEGHTTRMAAILKHFYEHRRATSDKNLTND